MALVADYRFDDDVLAKFWDRVEIGSSDECWPYTGRLVNGYGLFAVRRWLDRETPKPDGSRAYWGALLAHRIAVWSLTGVEPGESVDHVCHTNDPFCEGGNDCPHRRCCNPAHLESVSSAENARRRKGRVKETCLYGHPMVGDNIYVHANGRACRACMKRRNDENNARISAERRANPPLPKPAECPECLMIFMRPPASARKFCSEECSSDFNRRRSLERGRRLRAEDPEGVRLRQKEYYEKARPDPVLRAEAALGVACPKCGTGPGSACLSRLMQPTAKIHTERYAVIDALHTVEE